MNNVTKKFDYICFKSNMTKIYHRENKNPGNDEIV